MEPLGVFLVAATLLTGLIVARQATAVRENVRLLAQQAALRGEARFRALVQEASDVIADVDPAGTV